MAAGAGSTAWIGGGGLTNNARTSIHRQAGVASNAQRKSQASPPVAGDRGIVPVTSKRYAADKWTRNQVYYENNR